jgi:hypothetical protein
MILQPPSLQRPFHLRVLAAVRIIVVVAASLQAVGLASRVGLGAEVGRGGAALGEVAGEDRLEEGPEDNLGTTANNQSPVVVM